MYKNMIIETINSSDKKEYLYNVLYGKTQNIYYSQKEYFDGDKNFDFEYEAESDDYYILVAKELNVNSFRPIVTLEVAFTLDFHKDESYIVKLLSTSTKEALLEKKWFGTHMLQYSSADITDFLMKRFSKDLHEEQVMKDIFFLACKEGYRTIVKMFVDSGFNYDYVLNNVSPVDAAVENGHTEIISMLLKGD